jgi:hypothetical protein
LQCVDRFFHEANFPLPSLGKVLVEEAVEDRVGACAGHTEYVTDEEGQHHLFCKTKINNFNHACDRNSPVFSSLDSQKTQFLRNL